MAAHEQRHVDIFREGIEAFKRGVEQLSDISSNYDVLQSDVESLWLRESHLADQQQDEFHVSEQKISQTVREPVQEQIDSYELRLGEYQAELTRLSSQIDALGVQVDRIRGSMQPYKADMDTIEQQYPGLVLPPDTFNEYEWLRDEWNRLNGVRNSLIIQWDALVEQHNQVIEELNRLRDVTNMLLEELAWLP